MSLKAAGICFICDLMIFGALWFLFRGRVNTPTNTILFIILVVALQLAVAIVSMHKSKIRTSRSLP